MADKSIPSNIGGQYGGAMTGGAVETLVYTGAGRISRVFITTAGTASYSIYDGTQSTGGTLVFTSLTNDALGVVKELHIPVVTGIVVKGAAGTAGVYVTYNKDGAAGV